MSEPFTLVLLSEAERRTNSKRHAALGVFTVAVLLVGIGAAIVKRSESSSTSSSVILAASGKTKAAGSSKFTATIDVTADGNNVVSITMDGAVDTAKKVAAITINGAGTASELRMIDGVEYLHSDFATLPDGKQWVQIDPHALGIDTSGLSAPSDPTSELELLGGLAGEPNTIGHEQLDGVSVTHYGMTIDFASILDKVEAGSTALGSDSLVKGLQVLRSSVDLSHIPAEVWLGDDGVVRQFKFSLHLPANGKTIDEVAVMKFSDFGAPVSVEVPPADQVVPFSEVPDIFKNPTAN